jgi:hypothetical protein
MPRDVPQLPDHQAPRAIIMKHQNHRAPGPAIGLGSNRCFAPSCRARTRARTAISALLDTVILRPHRTTCSQTCSPWRGQDEPCRLPQELAGRMGCLPQHRSHVSRPDDHARRGRPGEWVRLGGTPRRSRRDGASSDGTRNAPGEPAGSAAVHASAVALFAVRHAAARRWPLALASGGTVSAQAVGRLHNYSAFTTRPPGASSSTPSCS